jgi:hypothetical protein
MMYRLFIYDFLFAFGSRAVDGKRFLKSNASSIPGIYIGSLIPGNYVCSSIPGTYVGSSIPNTYIRYLVLRN